jgi:hypothetical protein
MAGPLVTEDNRNVTEFDRFVRWGQDNVWGMPEPRWYDDQPFQDFTPDQQQALRDYESQNPYDRRPYMVQHMDNAGQMLGSAATSVGNMLRPEPTLGGKVMDFLGDAARNKRLTAEMELIDILLGELQRPPSRPATE